MEAPLAEMFIRLVLALVVTAAAVLLVAMSRLINGRPSRWVLYGLTVSMVVFAGWRWFVLWLGTQPETPDYQTHWEPVVRATGNVLLIIVIGAVGFMAAHHGRELRKGRTP